MITWQAAEKELVCDSVSTASGSKNDGKPSMVQEIANIFKKDPVKVSKFAKSL